MTCHVHIPAPIIPVCISTSYFIKGAERTDVRLVQRKNVSLLAEHGPWPLAHHTPPTPNTCLSSTHLLPYVPSFSYHGTLFRVLVLVLSCLDVVHGNGSTIHDTRVQSNQTCTKASTRQYNFIFLHSIFSVDKTKASE